MYSELLQEERLFSGFRGSRASLYIGAINKLW